MTREELFEWAADHLWELPALAELTEQTIENIIFLFLPGKRGVYRGIYICFSENSVVHKLRRKGFAVAIADNYDTARKLLSECAEFTKKCEAKKNRECWLKNR